MSNIFKNVRAPKRRYNNFNLSREVLLSGQIGKLIPIQCDEVVPGDRWKQNIGFLMRFAPLSAPVMARFNVHYHSFYVPYRIITTETSAESTWEKFVKSVGQASSEVPVLPHFYMDSEYVGASTFNTNVYNPLVEGIRKYMTDVGSLWDYLGLKTQGDTTKGFGFNGQISAMPFFAYQKIYNDFYRRDQIEKELQFPVNVGGISLDDFASSQFTPSQDNDENPWNWTELFKLRSRNYERDYFTSALPTPQFGDDVIVGDGLLSWINDDTTRLYAGGKLLNGQLKGLYSYSSTQSGVFYPVDSTPGSGAFLPSVSGAPLGNQEFEFGRVDVSSELGKELANNMRANTFTINELRLAIQLQGIREKINRGGTRYLEIMQSIYGVVVPDARIQRPVYLGGVKNPVSIGAVVQTSESQISPQGTLTGKAQAAGGANLFKTSYEFKEHGYLMTIMSVTPRTSYYGGIPRKFMKKYPEDFYLPDFDHLGEQEIMNSELYFNFDNDDMGDTSDNEGMFGYTPRYSELKSALSSVHGEFRTTLDNWHVSRDFDDKPALNTDFIKIESEDVSRIFEFENIENTSNEHFYCQIYLDVVAKRNMSKYSTPWTLY